MPFDGTAYPPRPTPQPNKPPTPASDTAVTVLIVVAAVVLLVTPLSLSALIDIVKYVRGG